MFYTLSRHNPLWSAIQKSDLWVLDAQWGELLQDVERPWAFATPLPAEDANLYCFGEHFSGPNWFTRLKRNVAILSVIDADGNCHLDRASCQFWIYWNWKPHPKTSETIIKYQILHCRVKLIRNMHAAMIRDDNWLTYTDTHTQRERYIYIWIMQRSHFFTHFPTPSSRARRLQQLRRQRWVQDPRGALGARGGALAVHWGGSSLGHLWYVTVAGWWFGTFGLFCFCHILGRIIPTDFHIFQRGWNHQPVCGMFQLIYLSKMVIFHSMWVNMAHL